MLPGTVGVWVGGKTRIMNQVSLHSKQFQLSGPDHRNKYFIKKLLCVTVPELRTMFLYSTVSMRELKLNCEVILSYRIMFDK